MSDPLSISASVIAVAGLAYSSCKVLIDTIKSFRNAPKTLADIRTELSAIQNLLDSLINTLSGVENTALSNNQRTCFVNLESAIKHCETICKDFTGRLLQITSHSGTDHVNWFDRTRLHFNENDVSLLKAALERDKQTLDVALGVATFQTVRQNGEALKSLEIKIADTMSEFTGQIQGIQLAARSWSMSNISINRADVEVVTRVLNEQDAMIKQCLKVCESGLKEVTVVTGTNVKHAVAFDKAAVFVGNMGYEGQTEPGNLSVKVDLLEARNEARAGTGFMSTEVAKSFWSQK